MASLWHRLAYRCTIFVLLVLSSTVLSEEQYYDVEVSLEDIINQKRSVADATKNDPGVIDIAAFNVRIFGKTKMSDAFVVEQLTKIILRYDLILIQEIRDSKETAIYSLLNNVNSKSGTTTYSLVQSTRLGRTSSKEQYAFMYRSDIFTVDNHYVYDDSAKDIFQREPFVVKFSSTVTAIPSFFAIGIHTMPTAAVTEIDHLVDVYDDAKTRFGISDAIIMGDFNAGCTYVNDDWSSIRLATDHRFYWLINDVKDTTSASTECAYDRLVIAGNKMLQAVEPLSPGTFHYDREYGLTSEQALKVSDHYPVEMKIKTAQDASRITLKRLFDIEDKGNNADTPVLPQNTFGYSIDVNYGLQGTTQVIKSFLVKSSASNFAQSLTNLNKLKTDMKPFISDLQVSSAKRHLTQLSMVAFLPKNNGFYYTLKDYYKTKAISYVVMANCQISAKRCSILLEVENGF